MKLQINKNRTFQTLEGFGMSGAWWAQEVGAWTSETDGVPTRDKIADLLYSEEKGIGMRIYRYNLGAGSAKNSEGVYWDRFRRADSFDTETGLDFTRDAGAVYMMKKCVESGADEVIFFVNSPILPLTKNHGAHVDKKHTGRTNLSRKNYPAFAKYCLDVTEHFLKEGLPITCISPVNEPLWVWNGSQEGCHYTPQQAQNVLKEFARQIKARPALRGLRLSGMENGDIRWLNKSYTRALLDEKEVRALVDGIDLHSYFLKAPLPFLNDRAGFLTRYRRWLDKRYPGVPVRISEWCHMQGGRDPGMDSALEQAKVMLEDMTLLNASSFQGWIACSPYDYCDGLIYIDPEKQSFTLTKRYFAFGNFTKFLRRGAKRIAAKTDDDTILCAAFTQEEETVLILLNPTDEEKSLTPEDAAEIWVTSEADDLRKYACLPGQTVSLQPKSVSTVVIRGS